MGTGRGTIAISAGALTLVLGGGLPLLIATPAQARDCGTGQGLLSGLTSGVCHLVDGVTDVLDHATIGLTAPVSQVLDTTVGTVNNVVGTVDQTLGKTVQSVGEAVKSTGQAVSGATGSGAVQGATDAAGDTMKGLGEVVGGRETEEPSTERSCRKDPECATDARARDEDGAGETGRTERPQTIKPARPVKKVGEQTLLPIEPYRPKPTTTRTSAEKPRVTPDEDAIIPLLWPVRDLPDLTITRSREPLRPDRPDDAAGTVLTAVLLLSAVLATRIVATRRARDEEARQAGIPLENGLWRPNAQGRHRLA